MKKFLTITSLVGILLFGTVFGLTYLDPEKVEQSTKGWVAKEIERKIKSDYPRLFPPEKHTEGSQVFKKFQGHLKKKILILREALFSDLPDRIAESIARSCTCRMKSHDRKEIQRKHEKTRRFVKELVVSVLKDKIDEGLILVDRADDLIQGHYLHTIEQLMFDIRIFSGTNAFLFALILLILSLKTQQEKPLMVAGGLLTVVTLTSAAFYTLGQNWFYTLMFNDYMGWGYLTLVGIITGLLLDVIFNKGSICCLIMEIVGAALTSIASICP